MQTMKNQKDKLLHIIAVVVIFVDLFLRFMNLTMAVLFNLGIMTTIIQYRVNQASGLQDPDDTNNVRNHIYLVQINVLEIVFTIWSIVNNLELLRNGLLFKRNIEPFISWLNHHGLSLIIVLSMVYMDSFLSILEFSELWIAPILAWNVMLLFIVCLYLNAIQEQELKETQTKMVLPV